MIMMVVDQPRTTKEELVDGLKAVGTGVIKNTIGYTHYLIMDWNHHFIKLTDSSEDRVLISHIVCSFRNCYKEFYLCCFHTCTTALNFSKRYPPRICMRARKHLIQPEETSFGLSEFALCDWCTDVRVVQVMVRWLQRYWYFQLGKMWLRRKET